MLPTFLVIGAPKAGTTSLAAYLEQHPEVFVSPIKEPEFFTLQDRIDRPFTGPGVERFAGTFVGSRAEYERLFADAQPSGQRGELSTAYLYSERAPSRIAELLPECKLIAILREPVARAWSHWKMNVRLGFEDLPFEEAIRCEDERAQRNWMPRAQYTKVGFYSDGLARYYDRFPRDQFLVLLYEDYVEQPERFMRRIFEFLGVDPTFRPDMSERLNAGEVVRSKRIDAALRSTRSPVKRLAMRTIPSPVRRRLGGTIRSANQRVLQLDLGAVFRLREFYAEDRPKVEQLTGLDLERWA
jgi:hypothetical protein